MSTVLYNDAYERAQELRDRLERMREWFGSHRDSDDVEGLRWRRQRYEAAQHEYQELLQILRAHAKLPPSGRPAMEDPGHGRYARQLE